MLSVGKVLQGARLEQQLDLPTVSARTKMSIRFLEAIESDDRRSLPSGFFYKSFVDQYARFLGVDTREINAEVERLISGDAPLPLPGYENVVSRSVSPMRARRFTPRRALVSLATLVTVMLGCSGIYLWWHQGKFWVFRNEATRSAPPLTTPASFSRETVVAAPPKTVRAEESEMVAATPGYKVLLNLVAREATWLSISSEGKRLFSGVLAANETKTVAGKESAWMKVGNAAGLDIRLNGKPIGPLGARGQVLVVVFTPDKFQIVPPASREGD